MKYSIITINYNNRDGLRKTIESVIHQTYHDIEYIIIDGGSTDGSVDVIKEYDKDIDYWVSEPDKGIYNAMNKGIAHAHGDYLNFMNSGDSFYNTDVLNDILPYLNNYDIIEGLIYKTKNKKFSTHRNKTVTMMSFYEGGLCHQACFIKHSLFNDSIYDESMHIAADWKFFLNKIVFENYTFSYSPVVVCSYEEGGISERPQYESIHQTERKQTLMTLLPPLVIADYERYSHKESPILDLIPQLNKTYRLHKYIYLAIKVALAIYNKLFFKNLTK